jgi:hypothetical protein
LASIDERALSFAVVGGFSLLATVSTADSHVSVCSLADPANPVLAGQANATSGTLSGDAHNTGAVAWGNINGNKANLYAMATDMSQGLWQFQEVSADLLTPAQVRLVVRRCLRRIADMAIPKRRQRSCQRALRQPVSSWRRLRKNTYRKGAVEYSIGTIYA